MARVLIPLAQGCEELEAVTIIDLLRRASIDVTTAGLEPGPVVASRGVTLLPDRLLDEVMEETFQMIVLPGGLPGADHLNNDPRIRMLLQRISGEQGYTAAICAAPKVLASAGLLGGRRATGYPGVLDSLRLNDVTIDPSAVVRDGPIITSRGPGTAMDFALELIAVLVGEEKRAEVEAGLAR
ncbi:MAG: DJ-1/PfpI family protein [Sedimenticola thiotaurini]|uniref:DJ-1/PfpI family protein n=1 Tax=Sedimenticola thiotaurini TaxID=1543721 RepID=A0A558DFH6_9GAMM|nr:MAG: DJ-1/PfpI family protein [Sedimenticola thiotaurini]